MGTGRNTLARAAAAAAMLLAPWGAANAERQCLDDAPVCLDSPLAPQELKQACNAIEARLGRDRGDPASKVKSRTADLDILFWLEDGAVAVPPRLLPQEPYMRPMLLELLDALDLATGEATPALPPGVPLRIDGLAIGVEPVTLTLDAADVIVTSLLGATDGHR